MRSKSTRRTSTLGLLTAAVLGLAACGSSGTSTTTPPVGGSSSAGSPSGSASQVACSSGQLKGTGSTFQETFEAQASADYAGACTGAQITYSGVGSGQGITDFGTKQNDFAGSDVLMKDDEQAKADSRCGSSKAIHVPIVAGGIAVLYNVSGVSSLKLDAETLAGIFAGKITKWNDPAIAGLNSGATLPDEPIVPVHRADGSGTTSVFSAYLDAGAKDTWTYGAGKTWPEALTNVGQAASKSDGVANLTKSTEGGITYDEESFKAQSGLPAATVDGADISADTVSKALSLATAAGSGGDIRVTLNFVPKDPSAYPISTVSYVIVCAKASSDNLVNNAPDLLKNYLGFVINQEQAQANALGFAPLPSSLQAMSNASVAAIA